MDSTSRFPIVAACWIAVCWAMCLVAQPPLQAQEGLSQAWRAAAISLDEIGSGELLLRDGQRWLPLPIVDIEARIDISGVLVRGRVTQRFLNPTSRTIEARYVFPLPERAAVHDMEMRIGERRIRSEIQLKQEALQTFERARVEGKKAALLEQSRPNLFSTTATNINPGEIIEVTLEYLDEVRVVADRYQLRLPLTFTPRYHPPTPAAPFEGDNVQAAAQQTSDSRDRSITGAQPIAPQAKVEIELHAGFALQRLSSPSHRIRAAQRGGRHSIRFETERIVADRDLRLHWEPDAGQSPQTSAFIEELDGHSYAMVMLIPPAASSESGTGLPTETLFVVDVSSSMAGPSIRQARAALLAALDRLRPEDRFNLLKFNDDNAVFSADFQYAEGVALQQARSWVNKLSATGGTAIHPALMQAMSLLGNSRTTSAQRIIFLTDGAVSNEAQLLQSIAAQLGDRRLHALGIGAAPNTYLMRKMAQLGRGLCQFIGATDGAVNEIDRFFTRLERPVVQGVELAADGVALEDVFPKVIPDLHLGEPLVLAARLDGVVDSGRIRLAGYTRNGWVETHVELANAVPAMGIATRWARANVEAWMDQMHEGVEAGVVQHAVETLALQHRLVTRYTSLVAVEERPTALDNPQLARVSAALPMGGTLRSLSLRVGLICLILGGIAAYLCSRVRLQS